MVRHYLVSALRGLAANRLLSFTSLLGLVVGIAGAIQMSLIAINALNFNHFIPDHDRIYLGVSQLSGPGMPAEPNELTIGLAAPLLAANVPQIEAIARLSPEEAVPIRLGATERKETIYWGDVDTFSVLHYPALHGDPGTALQRPDGLVMTAAASRRWFGTDDAIGQRLLIDGKAMTLRAVLRDQPPQQTDLAYGIVASGLKTGSPLATLAASAGTFSISVRTYVRARPDTEPATLEHAISRYVDTLVPLQMRGSYAMKLVRIDRIALDPGLHPGASDQLQIGTLIVLLVLFIATSNFVNLSLAMSSRRHREIGVRKVNGASARQIALQFEGETILLVLVAAIVALAASEWLVAPVNAFLDTNSTVESLHAPAFLLAVLSGALLLGAVAGAYPAFVLSRYQPAAILKPGPARAGSRSGLQTILVSGQFAILIGLIIVTAVIHQQRVYAVTEALRVDVGNVVTVQTPCPRGFVDEVARTPGVMAVSCNGDELLSGKTFAFLDVGSRRVPTNYVAALPATFALFGVHPVAGSLVGLPPRGEQPIGRIIVNETAARRFGYASPAKAVGQVIPIVPIDGATAVTVTIVAVVPDFSLTSVIDPVKPTIYLDMPSLRPGGGLVTIRLAPDQTMSSLDAIDRIWRDTGQAGVFDRAFVSAHIEALYRSLDRNTKLFAFFSALAIGLACLGLIGLSVAAADRRIKEIGVRKAMGASTSQILQLLLWQFSRPVLVANLVAWPLSWWAMRRWLDTFAYRVPLHWWLFPAAGLAVLLVAGMTVWQQSYGAARQRPVEALRYE